MHWKLMEHLKLWMWIELTVYSKQNEVYLMSKVASICLFLYLNKCIQFN